MTKGTSRKLENASARCGNYAMDTPASLSLGFCSSTLYPSQGTWPCCWSRTVEASRVSRKAEKKKKSQKKDGAKKSWLIKECLEKPGTIKPNRNRPFVWQWCWRAEWLQELKTPKCGLEKNPLWIKTANQKNQQKINSLNQIQIRVSSWGTISCSSLDHFSAVLFSQRGLESVSPLLVFQIFCEFYSERGKNIPT